MLLYYITDRRAFHGGNAQQRAALLEKIRTASRAGVDYIQLREKDLSMRELEQLARQVVLAVRENSAVTRLLINSRADIAIACAADGVHLPSHEVAPSEIRALLARNSTRTQLIGFSAHSVHEVRYAEAHGADLAVLAPIFEKIQPATDGIGIGALRAACLAPSQPHDTEAPEQRNFPVFALGGVTVSHARTCILAGAAGIAGIRLFQQGDVLETVRTLRSIGATH